MRLVRRIAALLSGTLCCAVARASAQDQDLMIKWTSFTIVRYQVVGEYKGDPVIGGGFGAVVNVPVTDRVELTFDWDQNETALVGTPTIKNFVSTMGTPKATGTGNCTGLRVSGAYEQWTLASVTPVFAQLQLKGTWTHPAAVVPYMGERGCAVNSVQASTGSDEITLDVLPAMMFGMPQALGENTTISKDGKSFVFAGRNGWTWTYTPTGVR
jgi:hypothetical protein